MLPDEAPQVAHSRVSELLLRMILLPYRFHCSISCLGLLCAQIVNFSWVRSHTSHFYHEKHFSTFPHPFFLFHISWFHIVSFHHDNHVSIVFSQREVMVNVVKKRKLDFVNLPTEWKELCNEPNGGLLKRLSSFLLSTQWYFLSRLRDFYFLSFHTRKRKTLDLFLCLFT